MTSSFFLFAFGYISLSQSHFCIQSPSSASVGRWIRIFSTHIPCRSRCLAQDDCAGLGVLVHAVANQQHVLTEEPLGRYGDEPSSSVMLAAWNSPFFWSKKSINLANKKNINHQKPCSSPWLGFMPLNQKNNWLSSAFSQTHVLPNALYKQFCRIWSGQTFVGSEHPGYCDWSKIQVAWVRSCWFVAGQALLSSYECYAGRESHAHISRISVVEIPISLLLANYHVLNLT